MSVFAGAPPAWAGLVIGLLAFLGIFIPGGAMAGMPGKGLREMRGIHPVLRGSPPPSRLINGRHALKSRRLLSIRRAAGFPGAARAAARDLHGSRAERQRAAGAGGYQRHR